MKVECLDNTNMERVLTVGEIYQVLEVGKFGDEYKLVADDGEVWRMSVKRFRVVEEERERRGGEIGTFADWMLLGGI